MGELTSSKREALQATYVALRLPPSEHAAANHGGRAIEKANLLAVLQPSHGEIAELKTRLGGTEAGPQPSGSGFHTPAEEGRSPAAQLQALDRVDVALSDVENLRPLRIAARVRSVAPETLLALADGLVALRQEKLREVADTGDAVLKAAVERQAMETATSDGLTPEAGVAEPAAKPAEPRRPMLRGVALREELASQPLHAPVTADGARAVPDRSAGSAVASGAEPATTNLKALFTWAKDSRIEPDRASQALQWGARLLPTFDMLQSDNLAAAIRAYTAHQHDLIDRFREHFAVEPVGYLHLERMTFTPAGIERGELMQSVPLAPDEEVNIAHKEWSNTTQEFEQIVTDFMEAYSEEGVTEKSELAQASSSQEQHSSGLNAGVTASGSYGVINTLNVTASVNQSAQDSASTSEQVSRNHSSTVTRKASRRVTKEHKVSFKVASAAGTEDQAVRRFKNPFKDKATRVDYYQLVRKWKVDLYRYGVRLTYDIVIPEPSVDILSRVRKIRTIQAELEMEFGPEERPIHPPPGWTPKPDWASFNLGPNEITPQKYAILGEQYGVDLTELQPPEPSSQIDQVDVKPALIKDPQWFVLEYTIDEKYQVANAWRDADWAGAPDEGDPEGWVEGINRLAVPDPNRKGWYPLPWLLGRSGTVRLVYYARAVHSMFVKLHLDLALKPEAMAAWQNKVWSRLREAAQARYNDHREMLKQQLNRLVEEIGAQDPLSLRKIEREEVMKGVLRWLLGPSLQFGPPGSEQLYDDSTKTINPAVWASVLSYGELIRFLQNAIEWENMVYVLYPYFWSAPGPEAWDLKKYLDHPDLTHRAFLKSGAARIVLTIRPGFEQDFTMLLQCGEYFAALAGSDGQEGNDSCNPQQSSHPYVSIAEEMQNYAKTNYPGIRPANQVEARPLLTYRQKQAWDDMQLLMRLLEVYHRDHGRYPSTADGLGVLQASIPLRDPWGTPYSYTSPEGQADYELLSFGATGQRGGVGEDADIHSNDLAPAPGSPRRAWDDMQLLQALLQAYRRKHGRYPATSEGLALLAASIPQQDPWNNPYAYTSPGSHADYDLASFGADGKLGPEPSGGLQDPEDEDIASWAEASLIGTWYEYTPTSAMDIAFNETTPSA